MSRISVCLTAYNHEDYIGQCLDSILDQTYKDVSIHVYDDCSPDKTFEIAEAYQEKHKNIFLYRNGTNRGVNGLAETQNRFIENADSEFCVFFDSDDYLELDYFEKMIDNVKGIDFIHGSLQVVDKNGIGKTVWNYGFWPTKGKDALKKAYDNYTCAYPHVGLIRTEFLKEMDVKWEYFDFGWGGDALFTINMALQAPRVKFINDLGPNWRIHGENSSFNVENRIRLAIEIRKHFLDNIDPHLYLSHRSIDVDKSKYMFGLMDMIRMKHQFQIPIMFHGDGVAEKMIELFPLFDEAINEMSVKAIDRDPSSEDKIALIMEREYVKR